VIQHIIVFIIVVVSVIYAIKSFFFKNKSQKYSNTEHKIVWKNNK